MTVRSDYARALDALTTAAQQELLNFWENREVLGVGRTAEFQALVTDLVEMYGAEAASAAADYIFMDWDANYSDDFARLRRPAEKVIDRAQAAKELGWALQTQSGGLANPATTATALERLQGVVTRLVLTPAHRTVARGCADAGTRYARLPEPGACSFCLMLASRGAVYSKDTVLGGGGRFHTSCRCVGIQVKPDRSDQPKVVTSLEYMWDELSQTLGTSPTAGQWADHIADLAS